MGSAVGIDLGTTRSSVAVIEEGRPQLVVAADGSPTTPSVVAWIPGAAPLVGQPALRRVETGDGTLVRAPKRFLGRTLDQVREEARRAPQKLAAGPGGPVRFDVGGTLVSPEEACAAILRKLARDASHHLGKPVTRVVLGVPACFDDAQRRALRDAGAIAGLEVLRLVNEPTAAALAHGLDRLGTRTVLVFDLGGGSLDVSLLDVTDGSCEVRATAGDPLLGGAEFDARIADWLAGKLPPGAGDLAQQPDALRRLAAAAETARIALTTERETRIALDRLVAGPSGSRDLATKLTRARFDELTADLVERCRGPVDRVLTDAKVTTDDVDDVVLVGGASRTPAVESLLRHLFPAAEIHVADAESAVALGAAIQAGIVEGRHPGVVLDVAPLSLGLETGGGFTHVLIERNTSIPARRREVFSTSEDGQSVLDLVVLQGERPHAADNRILGRFRLDGLPPAPRGTPEVEVTFDVDADGILHVSARDRESGVARAVTMAGAAGLDPADVQRAIAEARTHVRDDDAARAEAEVRERLAAALLRAERLLRDHAATLPPSSERASLEQRMVEARDTVAAGADPAKAGPLADELERLLAGLEPQ